MKWISNFSNALIESFIVINSKTRPILKGSTYKFFLLLPGFARFQQFKKKGHVVNSITSAQNETNYDKIKILSKFTKYTVKVDKEVRLKKKIDWINRPQAAAAKNPVGRPKAQNIIPNKPGLFTTAAKNATEPLKAFELFFDSIMMQMMIEKTNIAIQETRARMSAATLNSDKNCHFRVTNEMEIHGLLGMMYYLAMMN